MSWGAGSPASGRFWGRAGVVVLAVLGACAPSALPTVVGPSPSLESDIRDDLGVSLFPEFVLANDLPVLSPTDDTIPEAPETFVGPPPPAGEPVPQLELAEFLGRPSNPTGEGVWAVIIGIDDYPGRRSDLRFAGNDADDMDAALARFGVPPEQRLRLRDGQATADAIGRAMDWLADHAGPKATAVFSYAGHIRKLDSTTEALVGADGRLLRDAEVAWRLGGLQAASTWFVLAGCYAGGFTEVLAPGRILTGAAPANRLAYESSSLGRSYFGEYFVVRALLEGRADRSVEAAFAWALGELRRDYPDRLPVLFDHLDGDLLFGPAASAPRPPSPPPPPPSQPPPTTTTTQPQRQSWLGTNSQDDDGDSGCLLTWGSTVGCSDD